jgi:hypothetical protein
MIKIGAVVFYVCLLPLIDDAMCEEGILIADDCVVAERQMAHIVATMPSGREVFRGECQERVVDPHDAQGREPINEARRR